MPLNLEDKKVLVAEVTEVAKTALSVVAAEYRGLTVSQMTDLRAKARAQGVYMRVVKNTLARKALAGTALDRVANLPTRAQALSQLLGVLKAPIQKFVSTLAAPNQKLVRTIAAVRDAKS